MENEEIPIKKKKKNLRNHNMEYEKGTMKQLFVVFTWLLHK